MPGINIWHESHLSPKTHHLVWGIPSTSKWLIVHPIQADCVIGHKVVVIVAPAYKTFALLQSCVHVAWARFAGLHSTMQTTARYTSSSIFNTFPFPRPTEKQAIALEEMGKRYIEERVGLQRKTGLGATKIYNRLADPAEGCPWLHDFRFLHWEMNRMILEAYGWTDLVPPCLTDIPPCAEDGGIPPIMAEIVRRLRALNLQRSKE